MDDVFVKFSLNLNCNMKKYLIGIFLLVLQNPTTVPPTTRPSPKSSNRKTTTENPESHGYLS